MARPHAALPIMLAAIVGGCMPQMTEQAPQGPADVSMAKHISAAPGVRIGEDESADILVSETNAMCRSGSARTC